MFSSDALREEAGEQMYALGVRLFRRALVREKERSETEARYIVADGDARRHVTVTPTGAECDCGTEQCCHQVAAVLFAAASGALTEMERYLASTSAPALLESVMKTLPVSDSVALQPVLLYKDEALYIALRVGEERMYVVRSIPRFLEARETGEEVPFGKGFSYRPAWMRFAPDAENLLDILSEYCEDLNGAALTGNAARILKLKPRTAKRVLDALRDMDFELRVGEESASFSGIGTLETDFLFTFSGSFRELRLRCDVPQGMRNVAGLKEYVLSGGALYHVREKDRAIVEALVKYGRGGRALFIFPEKDVKRVLGELMPALLASGRVVMEGELEKRMIRLPVRAKIYLDREGVDVTCRAAFQYGDVEIDPFDREADEKKMLIIRDVKKEYAVLDELAANGFHVQAGRVYLRGSDRIYDFVTEGVQRLSAAAELYMSRDFRRITVRRPK
ncbi:MAG: SNF2 helicase associated domain-containing protein, partial [Clostridia bacterium]|nr:SNF2 helicase associated domain-containing protein [Clostridia bacterium]